MLGEYVDHSTLKPNVRETFLFQGIHFYSLFSILKKKVSFGKFLGLTLFRWVSLIFYGQWAHPIKHDIERGWFKF